MSATNPLLRIQQDECINSQCHLLLERIYMRSLICIHGLPFSDLFCCIITKCLWLRIVVTMNSRTMEGNKLPCRCHNLENRDAQYSQSPF